MLFLYSLPSTGMAALVVSAIVVLVLAGYAMARRFTLIEIDAEQRAMAVSMVSIITTINSLLVAFAAINVWDTYNSADRTVAAEAAAAGELARDLAAFDSSAADAAGQALRTYLVMVVHQEWPQMQRHGKPDAHTEQRFDAMFDLANRIRPLDSRQTVLLAEVLTRVNEMVKYRQQRVLTLHAAMPNTLWGVIVIVSALSFAVRAAGHALQPGADHRLGHHHRPGVLLPARGRSPVRGRIQRQRRPAAAHHRHPGDQRHLARAVAVPAPT